MKYPQVNELPSTRQMIAIFRGYEHNLRVTETISTRGRSSWAFYDTKNLTAAYYPALSPRSSRRTYATPASAQGLIAKDTLCYVDGTAFVIDEHRVEMNLSTEEKDCPKTLVSMGAYVIILPDKMWINTMDLTDFGQIEASFTTTSDVTFELCTISGESYEGAIASPDAPSNPQNRTLWIDTSTTPHALKQYSSTSSMWVTVPTTYVKIRSTGIGKAFAQYDGVTISGVKHDSLQDLNASMVIWDRGDDYIVVVGILDSVITQTEAVKVERRMPNMDFVVECGNRLWGCRYGIAANGETVNEIYGSKLGDFKNWNCFMGISTDSWAASVGTDGQFTGAITHLGYPLFFKEDCLHKVYISSSGAHQIQDTACRGVQRGCERSLAIVNGVLYYKARSGVCGYDGSLPSEVSAALGDVVYSAAVAGGNGNCYHISMRDAGGVYHLFTYDTSKGIWLREDNTQADAFCACRGEMYYIDHADGAIRKLYGGADKVEWMAETGAIGITFPDQKYVSRLTFRMALSTGAEVKIYGQYDSRGPWEQLCRLHGTTMRSFTVPIRPKRCDHMMLRIEGVGEAKVYSVTENIEQGSDVS